MKKGFNYSDRNKMTALFEAGLSADQIAGQLNISYTAVESHLATIKPKPKKKAKAKPKPKPAVQSLELGQEVKD